MKTHNLNLVLAAVLYLSSPVAIGQGGASQQLQSDANALSESMPTGTVPATNVLGVADSAVPRITNFKAVVTQFSQGINRDGKITSPIGFEVNPYLLANDSLSWSAYDTSYSTRLLTRTTVSFAANPSDDKKSASSAVGAQAIFYSNALEKARTAFDKCNVAKANARLLDFANGLNPYGKKVDKKGDPIRQELTPSEQAEYDQILKAKDDAHPDCLKRINGQLQAWNATVVAAGLGWGFYSPTSSIDTLKTTSSVYWATAALGWGDGTSNSEVAGLLTLHARRAFDERTPDPTDSTQPLAENSMLYGLNIRFGSPKLGVLAEYSSKHTTTSGLADEDIRRGFAGMDIKLADDLYLSWGVGTETGHRDGKDRVFSLANVKYAFGSKPIFRP